MTAAEPECDSHGVWTDAITQRSLFNRVVATVHLNDCRRMPKSPSSALYV